MDHASDTSEFLRTLARAEAASAREVWEVAVPLWERVVAANPVEGRFWTALAGARYGTKEFHGAGEAYVRAHDLGDGFPAETTYRIACCYAQRGEAETALEWLARALDAGYRDLERAQSDDDWKSLRDDARYREVVGLVETTGMSRDEGWRHDLRVLAREIKRRAYDPFRFFSEARFDAAVATINRAIPDLTDAQVIVELIKLLHPLGDGHARLRPADDNDALWQALPVQFFLFDEGLFITAADPAHADLLGARVERFDQSTVAEAIAALDPLLHRDNDNQQWPKTVLPGRLREVPILHALGLVAEPASVTMTLRDLSGEQRSVRLETIRDQLPAQREHPSPHPYGWISFAETRPGPLPLYLRNQGVAYWFTYLSEERTVYFQFNAVRDDPREPLADFSARLFMFIDQHEIDKLVVDLRWNDGGNTFLALSLLQRLIGSKVNRRGRLWAIIGRRTFSAAQNCAGMLDLNTEAIFVGEPTGSSPTFVGETVEFTLPYSKTVANVSDLLWQSTWPMDYRTWIAPTIYLPPTFAAYHSNCDPALEAILAWHDHLPGL